MADDSDRINRSKSYLTSRRGYMKMAFGGLVGSQLLRSEAVQNVAATSNTVDLGEQGLSNGDVIDDYLADHLQSGTEVRVPEGEYEWRGDGIGGSYNNAALVGDGDVTFDFSGEYWNTSIFAVDGGDFAIQNVTIRGALESGSNKSRFRFDARDADSTITLDNFNLPDGDVGQGRAIGIYVGLEHAGTVHVNNCHVEGFPNNGLYAGPYGQSSGGGGRVVVENSFFKNNNIDAVRLGGDGDTIRNCVIVQEEVPAYHNGAKSGRGIRIRYPGDDITVENVHITCDTSSPFLVPDRAEGPSGQVDGLYVENSTGTTAAYVESGSFTGDTIHVTGSGNTNVTGFDSASNVVSGSDAESPATSLSELDGSSDGTSGDSDAESSSETDSEDSSGNGSSEDDTSSLSHTITIDGSTSTEKQYHFEVSGEVRADSGINPDDTINESSVDGTMFGGSDSYQFSGELTDFTSDSLGDMTVYVDGSRIDPSASGSYPNEITIEGTGDYEKPYSFAVSGEIEPGSSINPDDSVSESSVDGVVWFSADHYEFSGDVTELEVDSSDEVTVSINGTEVEPSEFGSEPLPKRIVIDGTKTDGDAAYSFEVSEAVEKSTDVGDLESDDSISGTSVTGTLGNDLDGYRFAGELQSITVEGAALFTIEQTTSS